MRTSLRAWRGSSLLLCVLTLGSCSALPLGDPPPPEAGVRPVGAAIGLVVPLCRGEVIKHVTLTPEQPSGSPPVAWSGTAIDPHNGRPVLDQHDFANIEGRYDVGRPYVAEIITNKVVYVGVWTAAAQAVPKGSVYVSGRVLKADALKPSGCRG